MLLPSVNYTEQSAAQSILGWNGLNKSDSTADGEVVDCLNLSSRRYPFLAPRKGRTPEGEYSSPTALLAWDKLVVVDDEGTLYYDGEPAGNLTPGAKQVVGINNQIVIWPDKKVFDIEENEFGNLESSVTTAAEVTTTVNSVSFAIGKLYQSNVSLSPGIMISNSSYAPYIYTYGTSDDMEAHWIPLTLPPSYSPSLITG